MTDSKAIPPKFIMHPDATFRFWRDNHGRTHIEALPGGPVARGYALCAARLVNLELELKRRGLLDEEGNLHEEP